MPNTQNKSVINRRKFLTGAAATAAFTIVPRHVLGGNGHTPPSEQVNVAFVGAGGNMCRNNMNYLKAQAGDAVNYVALCEVINDPQHWQKEGAEAWKQYCPDAKLYVDYRKMLEEQRDIDAIVVCTPDHVHAAVSMAAIESGKHVYCEKPLTHTISEARKISEAARAAQVATQMGNNAHAGEWIRLCCEFIWDDAIGPVREVHAWSDRPIGYWKELCGRQRPTETPLVPPWLNWDLWLGPAPQRPYHSDYLRQIWRAWWDFGTGTIGDMGCHILDPVFWALDLREPITVEASSTGVNGETYPGGSIIRYEFGPRGDMPPLKLTWYDGGLLPPRPEELEPDRKLPENALLCIGDKGKMLCPFATGPRLIPETKMQDYQRPEKSLPRSVGHFNEWVQACKDPAKTCGSGFDYAGPLTELVLLANVALRAGTKLTWDQTQMKVTNLDEANHYVQHHYRNGWNL